MGRDRYRSLSPAVSVPDRRNRIGRDFSRTPARWRLRGGWPSESIAAAMAETAESRKVGRARRYEADAQIVELELELERTEALLAARMREAESRR